VLLFLASEVVPLHSLDSMHTSACVLPVKVHKCDLHFQLALAQYWNFVTWPRHLDLMSLRSAGGEKGVGLD